jgi:alkyldihydroxyacetonephosphate synthase
LQEAWCQKRTVYLIQGDPGIYNIT